MNLIDKITKYLLVIAPACVGLVMGCQKMSRPALPANYPKDNVTLPAGPLRFYLPFDSTSAADKQLNIRFADSMSGYPSFFPDASTTAVPGVRGTAYQGSTGTFLHYYTANDFGKSTSFTISMWLQATVAQKDHNNADGLLAFSSTKNFWGNATVFADHETSTSDSGIFKIHFANGTGDNWDFAGYSGDKRFPHMYDGNWHLFTFTYDASTKTGTMYYDGVQFDQKTNETIAFDGNDSQLVIGGFQEAVSIVDTYADNSWMSGWPGAIDNVRLYNTALSASDVLGLYNNKQ
jgi:hypothetical protein